ncbi:MULTISPECIES: BTAD domain-containing putative transcriptional regulator [Actinomadura]|uniref:OmpR/PhoB-type domain-containing protein n=1 Tax=Actinomadura litoris TaxID=2678616 RepID=A0A7K1L537_9ACTN|nr:MULTISPECIES: BTAD domain-containing putative transcriptional regulator [Actinomadura]MBT2212408.1 winged helix-turn-helix domain-containing protein [Actinomadura sp. NEAU-AAG7]MUN39393.1 hypothetical protein [Actinomadura litoris]
MIRFQVLGPVKMWVQDAQVDLGPKRQRSVLAVLLTEAVEPVPLRSLIDRVWGDTPPDQARNVAYTYIARLRRILAEATDRTGTPVALHRDDVGYRLSIASDQVDLHLFRCMVKRARMLPAGARERRSLLDGALRLWQGEALADLDNEWAVLFRNNLLQLRQETLAEWADAELRAGEWDQVIEDLRQELMKAPMAELLHERLVRALYASGRRAEALVQYEAVRQAIADELGADPGPDLQELHRTILRGDPLPAPGRSSAQPCQRGCRGSKRTRAHSPSGQPPLPGKPRYGTDRP